MIVDGEFELEGELVLAGLERVCTIWV